MWCAVYEGEFLELVQNEAIGMEIGMEIVVAMSLVPQGSLSLARCGI